MISEIIITRMSVNDDSVAIGEWLVDDGDQVEEGDEIGTLETSKQTVTLHAPSAGFVKIIVEPGDERAVGTVIAVVASTKKEAEGAAEKIKTDQKKNQADQQQAKAASVAQPGQADDTRKYTEKAKELIRKYQIDTSQLPVDRIIREKDVEQLIEKPFQIGETTGNSLVIYGSGGFSIIIMDILKQNNAFKLQGIVDQRFPEIKEVKGVEVIGNDEMLDALYQKGIRNIVNAVGTSRKKAYEKLKSKHFNFPNIIHNRAVMEPTVQMGEGNLIGAGAIIGSHVVIGNNCVINAGAIISHECIISDNCHIASGAVLAGLVTVGENTLIGQGCTVYSHIKIGRNVVIQNGSHAFRDVPDNAVVKAG